MPRSKKTSANQDPNAPNKARRTGPLAKDEARIVNEVRKRGACHECYKKKRKCVHTREQIEASQQRQQHHHQTPAEKPRSGTTSPTATINTSAQMSSQESHQIYYPNTIQANNAPIYNGRQHSQYSPNINVNSTLGQILAGEASHAWTMHQPASHGPGPVTGIMYDVGHPVDLLTGGTLPGHTLSMTRYNKVQSDMDIYLDTFDQSTLPSPLPSQLTPSFMDYTTVDMSTHQPPQPYQHYQLYPSEYISTPYSPHIMSSSPPSSPYSYNDAYPLPPKTPFFSFTSFLNDDISLPNLEGTFEIISDVQSPLSSAPSTPSATHSETSSVIDEDPESPRTEDMSDLEYEMILVAEGMNNDEYYMNNTRILDVSVD